MAMYSSRNSKRARRNDGSSVPATITTPLCCLCMDSDKSSFYCADQEVTGCYSPRQQQHLQEQHVYFPKTLSASTIATATSCRSAGSSAMEHDLCPVTGVYGNINNDYYICSEVIGKGHYGIVRECVHLATQQEFAVKTIDKSKIGRMDHLQREIYLLANVNHRNVMRMVDCYEDAEFVHIVTQKYTGGELFDQIIARTHSQGCFSERRAAAVIKSLLEAVAYLHDVGVVHRDIKPENILFESRSEGADVRLIDFGLSRVHGVGEAPMANPVGTAYYMSPEVLKGRYDRSCDIWAAGVVTYIMLSGYPPFNGGSDAEIQDATRRGRLNFQGAPWLTKSDEAVDFIRCLLRRDPRKRFTARQALMHPWIRKNVAYC